MTFKLEATGALSVKCHLIQTPANKHNRYIFRKKANVSLHHVTFNNTNVVTCSSQKYLGFALDEQLNFIDHIQSKMSKCYKISGIVNQKKRYSPVKLVASSQTKYVVYSRILFDFNIIICNAQYSNFLFTIFGRK